MYKKRENFCGNENRWKNTRLNLCTDKEEKREIIDKKYKCDFECLFQLQTFFTLLEWKFTGFMHTNTKDVHIHLNNVEFLASTNKIGFVRNI